MATKHATPAQATQKPKTAAKPTREPRSRIADLDVDERRAFEEWKRNKEQNQEAWEHKTNEELELQFLEKLNKKGQKRSKKSKSQGSSADSPCGNIKPQPDLEMLAEKVFQRLIVEARIERERVGWAG